MNTCDGIVRGDYRSPNGANRHALCTYRRRFKVKNTAGESIGEYCGAHVRRFRKMNVLCGPIYVIEEVA